MAVTYALAGVVTGLLGASFNIQAWLQAPAVLIGFAALFAALALACFGLYELQLPAALRERLQNSSQRLRGGHLLGVFLIGALSALVVSPCVSPPLAGALLYIGATQDAVKGGLVLLMLALGMGIPLVVVAVLVVHDFRRAVPGCRRWKVFYGVLLLGVAIWLLERIIPAGLTLLLWALLAAIYGVQFGAFEAATAGWQRFWKGIGLLLFLYAVLLLIGAVTGAQDPLRPLSRFQAQTGSEVPGAAQKIPAGFQRVSQPSQLKQLLRSAAIADQPVMVDFYADWCISCKIMDREVFSQPDVQAALSGYQLIQLDITQNTPAQQALIEQLSIFGPPAILFYGADGQEQKTLRVLGEMGHDQSLQHLVSSKDKRAPGG